MSNRDKQDSVFKALADSRRREILDLLKSEPKTTGSLCDHFQQLDRCTVMQHLSVLEKAGLVIVRREGRIRWNHLNALPIKEIYDRWISEYAHNAISMLAKMKREIES